GYTLSVDLENQTVSDDKGFKRSFEIDPFRKSCLLKGLDDIGLTLERESDISTYEKKGLPIPQMVDPVDIQFYSPRN
ncbi:MAG: hypothetical protein WA244_09785, partial [Candidatus Acidiferrales bacterium]